VAGEDFGQKINENLERADLVLLLISADFIASKYCYEIEMKRALERQAEGEARVVPVIVRDVKWKAIPELSNLKVVPKDGKAVHNWKRKDTAWLDVSDQIETVIKDMRPQGYSADSCAEAYRTGRSSGREETRLKPRLSWPRV
jgi:internalin A